MAQTSFLCRHHQLSLVAEMSVPDDPPRPSSNQHDLRMVTPLSGSPAPRRVSRASVLNSDSFVLETGIVVDACIQSAIRGQKASAEPLTGSHEVVLHCTEEIRRRNRENFEEMCSVLELSTSSIYRSVQQIFRAMFEDNTINWGRILSLLAFGGHLAQYCSKNRMGEVTESLTAWTSAFIYTRLQAWIVEHGGWVCRYQ